MIYYFWKGLFFLPMLHLFDKNYNKYNNDDR